MASESVRQKDIWGIGQLIDKYGPFYLHELQRTASLGDGGHGLISVPRLDTLTKELDSLLGRYPNVKNIFYYICDGETTLKRILKSFEEACKS